MGGAKGENFLLLAQFRSGAAAERGGRVAEKFSGVSGGPRPPHKSPLDTNAGECEGGRGSSFFVSVNLRVEGKSIS